MRDQVKQILKTIITQHGREVVEQKKRVKSLLLDLCAPEDKRDVRVLVTVLDEGYVDSILRDNGKSSNTVLRYKYAQFGLTTLFRTRTC